MAILVLDRLRTGCMIRTESEQVHERHTTMSNMSYCRFQNTLSDLSDCVEHMDDTDLSDEERRAMQKLIDVCATITGHYGEGTEAFHDED